jgi:hypothetical protein
MRPGPADVQEREQGDEYETKGYDRMINMPSVTGGKNKEDGDGCATEDQHSVKKLPQKARTYGTDFQKGINKQGRRRVIHGYAGKISKFPSLPPKYYSVAIPWPLLENPSSRDPGISSGRALCDSFILPETRYYIL